MSSVLRRTGPFQYSNPRLYVLFTTLYNARAYYPVLAIFFTDLGLPVERYVLLNAVWAAAIFLLEVPSGALADTFGRRPLLIFSAFAMAVEMLLLLVAPKDGGTLLFVLCILNRALSGASEAAASGADESIAYDALPEEGRKEAWDQVKGTAMKWQGVAFLIAMILGGALYDVSWLNAVLARLPGHLFVPTAVAHRLPVAVVLLQALVCIFITLRMEEARPHHEESALTRCRQAFRVTLRTAKNAFTTRNIAVVILGGLLIDSAARNFATVGSQYYRLIHYPEWTFGLIGAVSGLSSWLVPGLAGALNRRFTPLGVLAVAALLAGGCLTLLAPAWPWVGLLPALALMLLLGLVGFTLSRHLHENAESSERATLLSVKGMAFNLGYGAFSLVFAGLIRGSGLKDDSQSFQAALYWQLPVFFALVLLFFGWAFLTRKKGERV